MTGIEPISVQPLREILYDVLRKRIADGYLKAGEFIDINELSEALTVSKTPIRDALLALSSEGFIDVLPRRGFVVHRLTLHDIQNLYQLIGALESAAFEESIPRIDSAYRTILHELNAAMRHAVSANDLQRYYELNCAFHNHYIHRSNNTELIRHADIYRQRLYDFPFRRKLLTEWEARSVEEHETFLSYIDAGEYDAASRFIRAVHWSFDVQREYIELYYSDASEKETQ